MNLTLTETIYQFSIRLGLALVFFYIFGTLQFHILSSL